MKQTKYIKRQDSHWKQAWGYSGETSLNLSHEILEFLTNGMVSPGEQCGITFIIYKKDFLNALDFIESQLPLYVSTSKSCDLIHRGDILLTNLRNNIWSIFGDRDRIEYTINLYYRKDGRIYLNGLRQKGFSIRDYLIENSSVLEFIIRDGDYTLHVLSSVSEYNY